MQCIIRERERERESERERERERELLQNFQTFSNVRAVSYFLDIIFRRGVKTEGVIHLDRPFEKT